jgi:hypothetical protein
MSSMILVGSLTFGDELKLARVELTLARLELGRTVGLIILAWKSFATRFEMSRRRFEERFGKRKQGSGGQKHKRTDPTVPSQKTGMRAVVMAQPSC